MAERFLIRTEGGPCDGQVRVANADGEDSWSWPLPDVLKYGPARPGHQAGDYVKVAESDLEPQPPGSRVVRGATYEWQAIDG